MAYFEQWSEERKELKSGLGDSIKIVAGFIPGDPARIVATVNGKNPRSGRNARILANSPAMLEAIVEVEKYIAENGCGNCDGDQRMLKMLRAVLVDTLGKKVIG